VLSIVCTTLYSIFNGVSVYMFIPLLDMLFRSPQAGAITPPANFFNVPGSALALSAKQWFFQFVFGGTPMEALMKICLIVFLSFFLKDIFGYMQSFFMN
jgi:subfamily B ATP-binding cassette protein MsbA